MVARLLEALQDTPAVFLRGARQTGKSAPGQEFVPFGEKLLAAPVSMLWAPA
jgi:predicted AAA+ superfamily ATPase